jgi:hypothetical protein
MNAKLPTQKELSAALERATRLALEKLFSEHSETFYYVSLITTGEAHAPFLSAWSREALAAEAKNQGLTSEELLKWSYADSPYSIFGEEFFEEVNRLFDQRPLIDGTLDKNERYAEFEFRLSAMETAMKRLDEKGMFGHGLERAKVVVAVEVMPPDRTNTERVLRLNPPEALVEWLSEIAEE